MVAGSEELELEGLSAAEDYGREGRPEFRASCCFAVVRGATVGYTAVTWRVLCVCECACFCVAFF